MKPNHSRQPPPRTTQPRSTSRRPASAARIVPPTAPTSAAGRIAGTGRARAGRGQDRGDLHPQQPEAVAGGDPETADHRTGDHADPTEEVPRRQQRQGPVLAQPVAEVGDQGVAAGPAQSLGAAQPETCRRQQRDRERVERRGPRDRGQGGRLPEVAGRDRPAAAMRCRNRLVHHGESRTGRPEAPATSPVAATEPVPASTTRGTATCATRKERSVIPTPNRSRKALRRAVTTPGFRGRRTAR